MFPTKTVDQKFGIVGGAVMVMFGAFATWRWLETDMLFFALFALRDFLAAAFLLWRFDAVTKCSWPHRLLAYVSSGLPLLYQMPIGPVSVAMSTVRGLLTVGGFALVTLATIDLGWRLGVSPANRGQRISTGVYRFFSHPMYEGYLIAEFGFALTGPATNRVLFLSALLLYSYRAKVESKILAGGIRFRI